MGEEPGEGAGSGHRGPTGGACIWPVRLGSQSTLILLSARPGAGLGNVTFQRKLFPFSPQERKRQKASKLLGSRGGRQASIGAPLLPLQSLSRCPEFSPAKDKWISQFIKRGRGVSLLTSLDSLLTSAFQAHYNATSLEPPLFCRQGGSLLGATSRRREVTLDLQGGAGSSILGLTLRPCLLSGAPHTVGKSEKLKTTNHRTSHSRCLSAVTSPRLILSCLIGDNSKHFISQPRQTVMLLNYKSNVTIFPIN